MPEGKPAGVRCVQLTPDNLCALFDDPRRPAVCEAFSASREVCGGDAGEAFARLQILERQTGRGWADSV
jgi:hypothetical protein